MCFPQLSFLCVVYPMLFSNFNDFVKIIDWKPLAMEHFQFTSIYEGSFGVVHFFKHFLKQFTGEGFSRKSEIETCSENSTLMNKIFHFEEIPLLWRHITLILWFLLWQIHFGDANQQIFEGGRFFFPYYNKNNNGKSSAPHGTYW